MQETPMRSSTVVAITLRLFAIYWVVQGVLMIPNALMTGTLGGSLSGWLPTLANLLAPILYGFLAFLSWIFAGAIATKVAGQGDPAIPLLQISRGDLFAFGLLVLGLYFFLNYLASSINWLHYLAIKGPESTKTGDPNTMYELSSQLIPCVAGLLMAITSTNFGQKLAGKRGVEPTPAA
jgi:hypothetical protein